MKKTASLLLALALIFALCCPAFAATLPEMTFDLSGDGSTVHTNPDGSTVNALEYVTTGDEITVYYAISAASATNCGVSQVEVYYDHEFFTLVDSSLTKEPGFSGFYVTPQTRSGNRHFVFFDTITTYAYGPEPKRIGSFTLKVIATGGASVITSTSFGAVQNRDKYPITTRDLWVGFDEWDGATFQVMLDPGEGALPDGVSSGYSVNTEKGETLTLPAPTRQFYEFDCWTDGEGTYSAGAEFSPEENTVLTALWTAVPQPKAPTGLSTVKVSSSGASDGKITGVTPDMEYCSQLQSNYYPCSGSAISNLSAGTYYVRVKADEAANVPAGRSAEVKVETWTQREAPTGLGTVKASRAGAADGSITGLSTAMEYSASSGFANAVRCTGTTVSGLADGTYYVRYAFDTASNRAAGAAAAVTVEAWPQREAPTGLSGRKTSLPEAADGMISGTTANMEYSRTPEDPSSFLPCPDGSLTGLRAGTYYVRYRFDAAANRAAGQTAEVVVNAGNAPERPENLVAVDASAPKRTDGKITGVTAKMEYSTTPEFSDALPCPEGTITGLGEGTYYVRVKADPTTNTPAGNYATLTVHAIPLTPEAPTGLSVLMASSPDASDGQIAGVTADMEYCGRNQGDYTPCTGTVIANLSAGTYYVRVKANEAENQTAGKIAEVTVTAWPLRDAPTGLWTVKASQPGARDGSISGLSTEMEYSTTAGFVSAIPCSVQTLTGLAAGTYYVRYVYDTANHRAASLAAAVTVEAWPLLDAPTGLSGRKTSLPEAADGMISGTTANMEYSLTPDDAASFLPCTDGSMSGLKAGTYFIRYRFDAEINRAAGKMAEVVVNAGNAPERPHNLSTVAASAPETQDGQITGVTAKMEYGTTPEFTDAISCPEGIITGLGAGTYYVRVKADPATNTPAGNYATVAVRAVPLKPEGLAAVKTSLPDSKDGQITGVNSLMEYSTDPAFTDAADCPDGQLKGLAAGIYYVRVKAQPETETPAGAYETVKVPAGEEPVFEKNEQRTAGKGTTDLAVQITLGEDAVATVSAVSDAEIKAAAAEGSGVVGIDLSEAEDAVEAAVLPAGMIGKIAVAVEQNGKGGFALKLTSATVEFDARALQSLAAQAGENALQINLLDTGTLGLNEAQAAAIQGMSIFGGYSISAEADGRTISRFDGGRIRISIPFNIPTGRYAYGFCAYYAAPDGALTRLSTAYEDGMLSFSVSHFSEYLIVYSEMSNFKDVVPGSYYENAVAWAVINGVTMGTSDSTFSPDGICTRAEIVTFLWRAAGSPAPIGSGGVFRDVPAGEFYSEAVAWAVTNGVTMGTSADTFSPDEVCTRAQIVTFLWRAMGQPSAKLDIQFRDVARDYYTEAVRWAVACGVTKGTSADTFSPDQTCTRAEAVTFLWRCMK